MVPAGKGARLSSTLEVGEGGVTTGHIPILSDAPMPINSSIQIRLPKLAGAVKSSRTQRTASVEGLVYPWFATI